MPPQISVLVPTYNYARFLPQTLDSILAQDFRSFEIVASDDCSSDDSVAILHSYARRDSRLRVILQPRNLGMVANWNECLRHARCEKIKYVFADDCLASPQTLGRMNELIESAPRITMVASARALLDENSQRTGIWDELETSGRYSGIELISRSLREDRNLIGEPSAVMFKREAASRGFDDRWRQLVDLEMWLHLLTSGDLIYTTEPLCAFRRHARQQSVLNCLSNVGPAERLWLYSRYQKFLSCQQQVRTNFADERRALFRCVYYSRRHVPRTAETRSMEAELESRLTRRWYRLWWCYHRMTKPLHNLTSFLRRNPLMGNGTLRSFTRGSPPAFPQRGGKFFRRFP